MFYGLTPPNTHLTKMIWNWRDLRRQISQNYSHEQRPLATFKLPIQIRREFFFVKDYIQLLPVDGRNGYAVCKAAERFQLRPLREYEIQCVPAEIIHFIIACNSESFMKPLYGKGEKFVFILDQRL